MMRKDISAKFLALILSCSMPAGLCMPAAPVYAAEESSVVQEIGGMDEETSEAEVTAENGAAEDAPEITEAVDEAEAPEEDLQNEAGNDPAEEISIEEELREGNQEETVGEDQAAAVVSGQYVLMNIPYDDFYKAEISNNVAVDAFTSATLNKTRTWGKTPEGQLNHEGLAAGSYHVDAGGKDITGIIYPVKIGEGVDLSDSAKYKEVKDGDRLDVTVTNRGNTTVTTYNGRETLFENPSYSYYVLNEIPKNYKTVNVENGKLVFGPVEGETAKTTVNAADLKVEFQTETSYGDYGMKITKKESSDTPDFLNGATVYGVVIGTDGTDIKGYGLRHMENIWRKTNLAWCTGFTKTVHNGPTSSAHYASMMGQKITDITYYTDKGVYEIPLSEAIYVPVKFEYTLTVADAPLGQGFTTISMSGLPQDYSPVYETRDSEARNLEGTGVSNGRLTYDAAKTARGNYTLVIKDAGGKYAPISAAFELYTDAPAVYDEKERKLKEKEGFAAADLTAYLGKITAVEINGTNYPASGRGAVTIISGNGLLDTKAAPLSKDGTYNITVKAAGYDDLKFTYKNEKYVLMNIPYDDFYKAEISSNSVPVDAFTSATLNKTRTWGKTPEGQLNHEGLAAGSYHVDAKGTDISGVIYPVKVADGTNLGSYREVKDTDRVDISVTNRGTTTTISYNGFEALFENANYSYYTLSENEIPEYCKEVKAENGRLVFGKAEGTRTALSSADVDLTLSTESGYGDYGMKVTKKGTNEGPDFLKEATVYGVVIGTGTKGYGLRHMENIWRKTDLAWCTGFTTEVHGGSTSSAHYQGMMGETIKNVTYYTDKGIYDIAADGNGIYVPVKFPYTLEVKNAPAAAGSTSISLNGLPEDYKALYEVANLTGASVTGSTLSYDGAQAGKGAYTLKITDQGGKYAPISAAFELYVDAPVLYHSADKKLVVKSGGKETDLAEYISSIVSAEINGKAYMATGRNAVKIINDDGTLNVEAEPIKGDGIYTIVLKATGYSPVEFHYSPNLKLDGVEKAIEKAEKLRKSNYTARSWGNLVRALEGAEGALKAAASQAELDQAAAQLNRAIGALAKAKPKKGVVLRAGTVKYLVKSSSSVTVKGPASKSLTKVSIPATVKIYGYKYNVTGIENKAFANCTKLQTVTIGKNVAAIGSKAFAGDKKLKSITVNTTKLKKGKVGANAFKKIKSTCKFKVPAKKVKAYKKIFQAKGAGKKIKVRK